MNRAPASEPRIIVVMGVCGCGKTSFGEALAGRLGAAFVEGDALHPPANVAKMSRGEPLSDEDRRPWLRAVAAEAATRARAGSRVVVACSALKKAYRDLLRGAGPGVAFVHLLGPREVALRRVGERAGHFMPAGLVDSQYATLEATADEADVVELDFSAAIEDNLARLRGTIIAGAAGGTEEPAL